MSKTNFIPKVPIMGQPIFTISDNLLEDRVTIVGERGFLSGLRYFAVDAILVKQQRYTDDSMKKLVINEGMHVEGDESKSLEVHMDLEKNSSREADGATVFIDEEEAQIVARKMNENQKKQCKKLLDLANKAYNEYDAVIALCSVKN